MILLQLGNFLRYNFMPVALGLQGALALERKVAHGNEDPQDKWKVGFRLGGMGHTTLKVWRESEQWAQVYQPFLPIQP